MQTNSNAFLAISMVLLSALGGGCTQEYSLPGPATTPPSPTPGATPVPTASPTPRPASNIVLTQPPATIVTDRAQSSRFVLERTDSNPGSRESASSNQYILTLDGGL